MSTKPEVVAGTNLPSVGLDIGTMNIVSARKVQTGDGTQVVTKRVRDAFLDLEPDAEKMLKLSEVSYIREQGRILVIGDAAMDMANLFRREARRPLQGGIISPKEVDAFHVLKTIIQQVIGTPVAEGEMCVYSVPAAPLDNPSQDVVYHRETFRQIIASLGFTPKPINEATAIVYAECAKDLFTGLAFSFGAGMVNVSLVYQTMEGLTFSLARSGDWIDAQSATALGTTASRMCAVKERGFGIVNPQTREAQALAVYYRALIDYTLKNVAAQFRSCPVSLEKPIPLILSGGTAKAAGFKELFESALHDLRDFPFEISEVRMASDPLTAVAAGALIMADQG
jgi:hypothetical protein